jgi:hypothetical protein
VCAGGRGVRGSCAGGMCVDEVGGGRGGAGVGAGARGRAARGRGLFCLRPQVGRGRTADALGIERLSFCRVWVDVMCLGFYNMVLL